MSALTQVLDYEAMKRDGTVKRGKPRRLHRTDCPHPAVTAVFRPATATEQATLPECADCARKHQQEAS